MAKKSQEEQEIEAIVKAQAANAVMWQQQAQVGQQVEKWVTDGHYDFIQKMVLNPVEAEWFRKVKSVRLGSSALQNVAKVQGGLEVFDIINARINHLIATGKDALAHLQDLQNSTH